MIGCYRRTLAYLSSNLGDSAGGIAVEIGDYLSDDAVPAAPPSTLFRLQRLCECTASAWHRDLLVVRMSIRTESLIS